MLLLPVMQFQVGSFCLRLRSLILPLRLNPHRVVNAICVAVAHSSSFPHFLQHFQFPVQSRAVADNCSNSPTTLAFNNLSLCYISHILPTSLSTDGFSFLLHNPFTFIWSMIYAKPHNSSLVSDWHHKSCFSVLSLFLFCWLLDTFFIISA